MEQIQSQGTSILRPHQVEDLSSEVERIEGALADRHAKIEDRPGMVRTLGKLKKQLETQKPKPFVGKELDIATREERELREQIQAGMLSQEEMRRNPSGAVGRHISWEKANKPKLLRWKELQLRLNPGSADPDIANFERFRPRVSTMNLDSAQIPKKAGFFFPDTIEVKNVMSPEERAAARASLEADLEKIRQLDEADAERIRQELKAEDKDADEGDKQEDQSEDKEEDKPRRRRR